MSEPIEYKCKPRQLRGFIEDCIFAGLVPLVTSSPGMGKSSIMHSVAKDNNLYLIDNRLTTSPPEDMTGLPRINARGYSEYAPFEELFPLEETPLKEGTQGWMIFLDELTSARREMQAAAYKLLLDKMTGQRKLNERVVITAAGNKITDRAIVNPFGTAMQSRVIHLELELDFDQWMMDVALKNKYDPRIIAYLSAYSSKLMDFDPNHNDKTFCCPRTWEFTNKLILPKESLEDAKPLLAGTITSGVAVDFVNFTKVFSQLVSVNEIIKNPETVTVPNDVNTLWATVSMMFEHTNEKNFKALSTYANRLPIDMRVLFYRNSLVNQPQLRQMPEFAKAMVELSNYLTS